MPKPFAATTIGSVPFLDYDEAVLSLKNLDVPAAPSLVKVSIWEDMLWGALHGLPALIIDQENQKVRAKRHNREEELAAFYEKFLAGEREFLAIPPEASRGFARLLAKANEDSSFGPEFLKIQCIGPVTMGQVILMDDEANALIDDEELSEATALAIGGKMAWAATEIKKTGRTPIVFLDEPGLSAFGSAFSTLTPETVRKVMGLAADTVRAAVPETLIGCHVCGNTDWSLLMSSGLNIVNFDAFEFWEQFCLYPQDLNKFLADGGFVAWGLVPAQGFTHDITADDLQARLNQAWDSLEQKGIPRELLVSQAMLSPACGLGTLSPSLAAAASDMLAEVSAKLKKQYDVA